MIEHPVVVMGVAGCGKSSLGVAIAEAEGAQLIEGDAHHSDANREKMRRGVPLTDADRAGWLDTLAGELRARGANTVLTCSALKRAYRDRLRAVVPEAAFRVHGHRPRVGAGARRSPRRALLFAFARDESVRGA